MEDSADAGKAKATFAALCLSSGMRFSLDFGGIQDYLDTTGSDMRDQTKLKTKASDSIRA